jgi:hypothetical protein
MSIFNEKWPHDFPYFNFFANKICSRAKDSFLSVFLLKHFNVKDQVAFLAF